MEETMQLNKNYEGFVCGRFICFWFDPWVGFCMTIPSAPGEQLRAEAEDQDP